MTEHYIDRWVEKETEKAYLVEIDIDNKLMGARTIYKWVSKSICRKAKADEAIEALDIPNELKEIYITSGKKRVGVPAWVAAEMREGYNGYRGAWK